VEAAEALRELTEISSQIEAAVLVSADGSLLAATPDAQGDRLASTAVELVRAAEAVAPQPDGAPLVQMEVATPEGSVFVARDDERVAAAVTRPEPTAGLVFYDLKSCLRAAAAEQGDGKPRPRARRTRKQDEEMSSEASA
jgi:predicted regulator of Ras-like GTPase activity (Roadblock/LC7/MglB family)